MDKAIAELRTAIQECDKPFPAMMQLADIFEGQGKKDEAITLCRQAIQQDPQAVAPRRRWRRCSCPSMTKPHRKTLEDACTALQGDDLATMQALLASFLLTNGERDKGLGLLRKLAADRPEDIQPRWRCSTRWRCRKTSRRPRS